VPPVLTTKVHKYLLWWFLAKWVLGTTVHQGTARGAPEPRTLLG
jgi:hypothetical protein